MSILFTLLEKCYSEKSLKQDENYFYLYKYMSFDPDLKVLDSIRNQVLKYTKPKFLDDEYENDFQINWAPFLKSEQITHEDNAKYKQHHGEKIEASLDRQLQHCFKTELGVCSLSSDPFNTSMWARYTNTNQGFLIEFKFPKNLGNISHLIPIPLIYKRNIRKLNGKELKKIFLDDDGINSNNDSEDETFGILQKLLFTKALNWKDQKEFRLLEISLSDEEKVVNNIILRKYPVEYLSTIVFGMNIDPKNKEKLEDIVKNLNNSHKINVETFDAIKHPKDATKYIADNHPRIK